MPKYILVGGHVWKAHDKGRAFYEEFIRGVERPVKYLFCGFAQPEEKAALRFQEAKQLFVLHMPDVPFEMQNAKERSFVEQVQWADAVYFSGGETLELIRKLEAIEGWKDALLLKQTVAGSSAGTSLLSRYSFNVDHAKMVKGAGLVPVKTIVHWKSSGYNPDIDWEAALETLDNYAEKLEILTLAEGEFRVIL